MRKFEIRGYDFSISADEHIVWYAVEAEKILESVVVSAGNAQRGLVGEMLAYIIVVFIDRGIGLRGNEDHLKLRIFSQRDSFLG